MAKKMVKECNIGQMGQSMMANGFKIKPLARAHLHILMEICIKGNGKMIKLMGLEFIPMLNLGLSMKDTGKMICCMVLESNCMKTVINIKECLNKGKDMVKELIHLQMEQFSRVIGKMVEFKGMES